MAGASLVGDTPAPGDLSHGVTNVAIRESLRVALLPRCHIG